MPRWEGWAECANYTHADGAAPSHGPGHNAIILYVCKTMTGGGGQHHEKVVCKRYIGTIYYTHTNAHGHPLRGMYTLHTHTHLNDWPVNKIAEKKKKTLL